MKSFRHATLLSAGLLAGASTLAIFQGLASGEANRRLEAALAQVPGLHVGTASVDIWTGRVALTNLAVEHDGTRVSASRVSFASRDAGIAGLLSPAFAADGSASADDIEIGAASAKFRIPHVEASGTTLTGDDLKQILDPKSTLSLVDRFDKLTAASITAPEISVNIAANQLTESIIYHNVALSDVTKGKIASMTVEDGTISVTAPTLKGPLEGTIGATAVKNLDLGLYARMVEETRTDADEALQPLYDSVTLDGMHLEGPDVKISVGKVSGSDVKARPFLTSVRDLMKMMPEAPGAKLDPSKTKDLMRFVGDLYKSLSVGSMEIRDISVQGGSGDNAGTFGVGRVGMSDMANARWGEFAIENVTVDGAGTSVKLGSFALRGFDFGTTLGALKDLSPDDPDAMKNINPRTLIPTIDQIAMTGLDADVPDPSHQGNSADGARDKFQIGKVELNAAHFLMGVPTSVSLVIDHVMADLPADNPKLAQITALGYDKVDMSSKLDIGWDEGTSELALKELSFSGANMGSIALSSTVGSVSKDLFTGDLAVAQAALFGVLVKEAGVRVMDQGLFDKGLALTAKASGKTPDQMRRELIAAASLGIPKALGDASGAKTIASAVAKFIARPKTLEITAKSAEGLGAADLQLLNQPAALFDKLQITATSGD